MLMKVNKSAKSRKSQRIFCSQLQKNKEMEKLPLDVMKEIFLLVPLITRIICRRVCKYWCSVLEEKVLWPFHSNSC
jgi:hypothetical protein